MRFSSCWGIIIKDNQLVVMEREKNGRKYCTFPGGYTEELKIFGKKLNGEYKVIK